MAIFKRRAASGGTWKTLACGGFDVDAIEPSKTTVLKLTDLTSVKGGLSMQADLVSVPLYGEQRKTISSRPQARELVLTFSSADSSGIEQNAIRDFFSTTRAIEYTDSERGLEETLWVQAIDDSFFEGKGNSLQVTCSCSDDTRLTRQRKLLTSGKLTASTTRIQADAVNDFPAGVPAVCELTLSSPKGAAAGVSSAATWSFMRSVPAPDGLWIWSFRFQGTSTAAAAPLELRVSSLDEGLGETRLLVTPGSGASGRFWQLEPGESAAIRIDVVGSPLVDGSEDLDYKLELVCIHPRGSADRD